jgi:hypothetical protein
MKKLLILSLALLAATAFAEKVNVFSCGFEPEEGYSTGLLYGQQGWTSYSEGYHYREVVDDVSYSGKQSVHIFTTEGHNSGEMHSVTYSNPYKVKVIYSFMFKPSDAPVRFQIFDVYGDRIKKFAISKSQFTVDNPYDAKNFSLDTDTWYPVTMVLDVRNYTFESFEIGDVLSTSFVYDNAQEASGDIGYIVFMTEWTDTAAHSYIDDISIDLVPEPASIGLLALVGLCLLRKRG